MSVKNHESSLFRRFIWGPRLVGSRLQRYGSDRCGVHGAFSGFGPAYQDGVSAKLAKSNGSNDQLVALYRLVLLVPSESTKKAKMKKA